MPIRYSKMLLLCDTAVSACCLYCRVNVPDCIRATSLSSCSEYASGGGGHAPWMQHLCFLCWVDHFLMLDDKHRSSHHGQVSSGVLHNGRHTHYAVEEHNVCYDTNKQGKCTALDLRVGHCWGSSRIPPSFFPPCYLGCFSTRGMNSWEHRLSLKWTSDGHVLSRGSSATLTHHSAEQFVITLEQ